MLLSLSYLAGRFNRQEDFIFYLKKFKTMIASSAVRTSMVSKYIQGRLLWQKIQDGTAPELHKNAKEPEIPLSISTHFEAKEICTFCGIVIPEEFIFSGFRKHEKDTKIECPNKECKQPFQPYFSCIPLDPDQNQTHNSNNVQEKEEDSTRLDNS